MPSRLTECSFATAQLGENISTMACFAQLAQQVGRDKLEWSKLYCRTEWKPALQHCRKTRRPICAVETRWIGSSGLDRKPRKFEHWDPLQVGFVPSSLTASVFLPLTWGLTLCTCRRAIAAILANDSSESHFWCNCSASLSLGAALASTLNVCTAKSNLIKHHYYYFSFSIWESFICLVASA